MTHLVVTIPAKLCLEISLDDDGGGGVDEGCVYFDPEALRAGDGSGISPELVDRLRRVIDDEDAPWPGLEVQRSAVPLALVDIRGGESPAMTHVVVLALDARDADAPGSWNWPDLTDGDVEVRAVYQLRSDLTSA